MRRILLLATVVALLVVMLAMSVAPAFAQVGPPERASCRGQLVVVSIREHGGQEVGQETSAAAQQGGIGADSSALAHQSGAC
jgi:hypothetical protein